MLWEKRPTLHALKGEPETARKPTRPLQTSQPSPAASRPVETILGRSLKLRGELSVNEDLVIEGEFEGTLRLQEHRITVGPNATVKSDIQAGEAIVHGCVEGNIVACSKIEVRKTSRVIGDLTAPGVVIEAGAYYKGHIEIQCKQESYGEEKKSPHERAALWPDTRHVADGGRVRIQQD